MALALGATTPLILSACTTADAQVDTTFHPLEGDQSNLYLIGLSLLGTPDVTTSPTNTIVSPVGAAAAASIVAEGTTSPTKINPEQLKPTWTQWAQWNGTPTDKPGDEPVIAARARLVADPEIPLKPAYTTAIKTWDIPIEATKITKTDLDAWADYNTAGLVKHSGIKVTGDTKIVLQNALTFAAKWDQPFNAEETDKDDFTRADGRTIRVDMMQSTNHTVPYVQTDTGWRGMRLDYSYGELAAFILVPGDTAQVNPTELHDITTQLAGTDVPTHNLNIGLPKVKVTTHKDLLGFFDHLGLGPTADLSGITDAPIKIAQAVQQAMLVVDEEGTVAAALTEVGMEVTATYNQEPAIDMIVDRPFYLVIGDVETGTPLFLSHIGDPNAS